MTEGVQTGDIGNGCSGTWVTHCALWVGVRRRLLRPDFQPAHRNLPDTNRFKLTPDSAA